VKFAAVTVLAAFVVGLAIWKLLHLIVFAAIIGTVFGLWLAHKLLR
jgi:hypothetical protein